MEKVNKQDQEVQDQEVQDPNLENDLEELQDTFEEIELEDFINDEGECLNVEYD